MEKRGKKVYLPRAFRCVLFSTIKSVISDIILSEKTFTDFDVRIENVDYNDNEVKCAYEFLFEKSIDPSIVYQDTGPIQTNHPYFGGEINFSNEFNCKIKTVIDKYFKIKKEFSDKVNENIELLGENFIGVHYRGTDKRCDCPLTSPDILLKYLDIYNGEKIYLATDEQNVVPKFVNKFGNNVVFINTPRCTDGLGIHNSPSIGIKDRLIGAVVDVYTLAKCKTLVSCHPSNFSQFPLFINPSVKNDFIYKRV